MKELDLIKKSSVHTGDQIRALSRATTEGVSQQATALLNSTLEAQAQCNRRQVEVQCTLEARAQCNRRRVLAQA